MPKAKTPKKIKPTGMSIEKDILVNHSHSYELSIQLGNEILKGSGNTALEALQSIKKPTKIVTKGEIILTNGDKKAQMTWQPAKLKRLFFPLVQAVLAKQLNYLLK